jgi:hypothetical protein
MMIEGIVARTNMTAPKRNIRVKPNPSPLSAVPDCSIDSPIHGPMALPIAPPIPYNPTPYAIFSFGRLSAASVTIRGPTKPYWTPLTNLNTINIGTLWNSAYPRFAKAPSAKTAINSLRLSSLVSAWPVKGFRRNETPKNIPARNPASCALVSRCFMYDAISGFTEACPTHSMKLANITQIKFLFHIVVGSAATRFSLNTPASELPVPTQGDLFGLEGQNTP